MAALILGLVLHLTVSTFGYDLKLLEASRPRIGIINGDPGKITDYPFMARYRHANTTSKLNQITCGAAIINERFLVTAAQCAIIRFQVDNDTDRRVVTVGADRVEDGEDYEIEKTMVHPYYALHFSTRVKADFDIAVIKLKKNLTFSERVRPIELAKEDFELKSGAVLTALGFGPNNVMEQPSLLKKAALSYMDYNTCRKTFMKYDRPISRRMLCAWSNKGGPCLGDGGSPIVYNGILVGVESVCSAFCIYNCTNLWGTMPAVYTSISKLRNFIDNIILYD